MLRGGYILKQEIIDIVESIPHEREHRHVCCWRRLSAFVQDGELSFGKRDVISFLGGLLLRKSDSSIFEMGK